jgi:hypothetical protein
MYAVCIHACLYMTCPYVPTIVYMVFLCRCLCVSIYMYVCMHVYLYVCVSVCQGIVSRCMLSAHVAPSIQCVRTLHTGRHPSMRIAVSERYSTRFWFYSDNSCGNCMRIKWISMHACCIVRINLEILSLNRKHSKWTMLHMQELL